MTGPKQEAFFIGELAARAGVTPDTIRYYESEGILPEPARSASGYRLYGPDDVGRIAFVGQAQRLGLTLAEIAEILDLVDDGREPCPHVRARLSARLEETRSRVRNLQALERRLENALAASGIEEDAATCRCRIIEGVAP